ncbi:MAG TPA: hypothetical protein VEW74_01640 [Candidatus Nitrosotalea sp.]|nr:hypothetical protein [Candidatus Nitrosotalea sp.]
MKLHLLLLVAMLAGCGGVSAVPPNMNAAQPPGRAHVGSWMAPGAKKLDLLYVSDYQTNDVDAYSYPGGKLEGVLKGILKDFPLQTGLCSDAAGDVFIPDSSDSSVLVYAHGAAQLSRRLLDLQEYPYSCAVDPAGGNLAVVNLFSISGAGGVAIYAHAEGSPKKYSYGFVYEYYFAGYDDRGNLFVDATDDVPSKPFAFVELRKGARKLEAITLNQSIAIPGGVGWDGRHVVVGDVRSSHLYRFDISGSVGTKAGSTQLGRARSVNQFVIAGSSVVGANFEGATVGFWNYPRGGAPAKTIGSLGEPFGVTLSRAHQM